MTRYLRYLASAILIVFLPAISQAADIYFAQTAQGSNNGTSCANAYAYNDSTYGINASQTASWVAGNTLHLCGTISAGAGVTGITVNGSGTSSAPITILFESGAVLEAPHFSNAIYLDGKSYITINGGTNGIIENTSNGSGLIYHSSSNGFYFAYAGASNITIENLTIQNLYVHNPPVGLTSMNGTTANCSTTCGLSVGAVVAVDSTSSSDCDFGVTSGLPTVTVTSATATSFSYASVPGCTGATGGEAVDIGIDAATVTCVGGFGSNITIANNVMHDAGWCLRMSFVNGDSNLSIYNNQIYNIDHGIAVAGSSSSSNPAGPFLLYSNYIHDFANWNGGAVNPYHHDGIHCFGGNNPANHLAGLYIYNNLFNSGTTTTSGFTGEIFIEGPNAGSPCSDNTSPIYIFNNVFLGMTNVQNGYLTAASGRLGIYNNTIIDNNPKDVTSGGGISFNEGGIPALSSLTFENNALSSSYILMLIAPTVSSLTLGYNAYGNGGAAAFYYGTSYSPSQFSSWQASVGGDAHSSYHSSLGLNSSGVPQAGAATIGAGTNLTSLCSGYLIPLCGTTSAGNTVTPMARPASGAWDAGAYQYSAAAAGPNPPTGLMATVQ